MVCQGCSGYIYSYTNTKKIEKNKEQLSKKKNKKKKHNSFCGSSFDISARKYYNRLVTPGALNMAVDH